MDTSRQPAKERKPVNDDFYDEYRASSPPTSFSINSMNFLFWMLCLLAALSPLLLLLAIGRLLFGTRLLGDHPILLPSRNEHLPFVSVIIAARNEEKNILACLASVNALTYPKERLEVLVGDDDSQDGTRQLVEGFISDKRWFRLVDIRTTVGMARGKANVLAQLTRQARGDYFFFTDADIELPRGWVEHMLEGFREKTGIVTGFTVIKGKRFFAGLQSIDWVYSLGFVSLLSDLGIPVSTLGNNMAVSRTAYNATAGYENLPFSITEDHQLFQEIVGRGYGFKQLMKVEVTALTNPMPNLRYWLHQRKRWMNAALNTAFSLRAIILLQILFFPLLYGIAQSSALWAWSIFVTRLVLQVLYIELMTTRVLRQGVGLNVFLYDLYTIVLQSILLVFWLLPSKIQWKNREY